MMLPILSKILQVLGFPESIRPVAGAIGQTREQTPIPVRLPAPGAARHILLTGANGHGASLAVARTLDNQIASGGGLIVLDVHADDWQKRRLERTAETTGRRADLRLLGEATPRFTKNGPEVPEIDFADVIAQNRIVHVTLPALGKSDTLTAIAKTLLTEIATAVGQSEPASPGCLVYLPNASDYLPDDPAPFLEAAQTKNVTVLVRDSYVQAFAEDTPLKEVALRQFWLKLCFREHGKAQAGLVADLLNDSLSQPHASVAPDNVQSLALGEFLLVQGDALTYAKLYPVNIP